MKDELGDKTVTKFVRLRMKTYNIQKYTLYQISQKCFEIMVVAILGKNLDPPMPKWINDLYIQENQEL